MPTTNRTKFAILGCLSMKPMSGYDVKKHIGSGMSNFWQENLGHIYPVLKKLELEGLVTKEVIVQEGRPSKNLYRTTRAGLDDLRQWLDLQEETRYIRDEFLLKILFGALVPTARSIERIDGQQARAEETLAHFLNHQEMLKKSLREVKDETGEVDKVSTFLLLTLRQGVMMARLIRDWSNDANRVLEAMERNEVFVDHLT